jgi:hypothetical protein
MVSLVYTQNKIEVPLEFLTTIALNIYRTYTIKYIFSVIESIHHKQWLNKLRLKEPQTSM